MLTSTNAKGETTTHTYDAVTGALLSTTGPVAGSTTTFTYDGFGRLQTVTEPDGYAVTTSDDALNRVTGRLYPDGTTETLTYSRLDLTAETDRPGRVTRHFHDPSTSLRVALSPSKGDGFGRRIATRDPAGRTIQQVWLGTPKRPHEGGCACGSLDALVDANGHRTTWACAPKQVRSRHAKA